jgi:membrane-associated phospholipid phosphatase
MLWRFAICALSVAPCIAIGQEAPQDTSSGWFGRDLSAFWKDAGYVATAPARFDASDWTTFAAITGGTAIMFTVDDPVRDFARRNTSNPADDFAEVGRQYGENVNVLILCGGVYLGGLAFGSEHVRTSGRMMIEASLFAGAATTVLKSVFGRSRPYVGEGPYRFHFFEIDNDYLSLPSGHATLAFAVSSVLASRIGNSVVSVVLYSLAALTACSRVYSDEHWLSDTALGAAIGTSVGLTIAQPRGEGGDRAGLRLMPIPGGVRVALNF